ncbi:MAG TPA: hypothetical protein VGP33_08520, partial [Chloroflexota bacterium]|nr:hypothetical protein [Chloroflexota bacterium]
MALQYVGPAAKYWYIPSPITNPGSNTSGAISITGWFRLATGFSSSSGQALFGVTNGSTTFHGATFWSTNNLTLQQRTSGGGSGTVTQIANPTDLAWHFMAFQITSNTGTGSPGMNAGTDGLPLSTNSSLSLDPFTNSWTRLFFGGGGGIGFLSGSNTFEQVAEIAVWDNGLSPTDIAFLYNGGTAGAGGSPKSASITSANLIAYLRLISSFADLGPNNYTPTAVGSPTATWVSGPTVDNPPSGITVTVDMPSPTEFLRSIAHDSSEPLTWNSSLNANGVNPTEFLRTQQVSVASPAESLRLQATSVFFPADLLASIRRDEPQPIEWRGTLLLNIDAPLPLEFLAQRAISALFPTEALISARRDEPQQMELLAQRNLDATSPVEWLRNLTLDARSPIDWLRGMTADQLMPSELLAR